MNSTGAVLRGPAVPATPCAATLRGCHCAQPSSSRFCGANLEVVEVRVPRAVLARAWSVQASSSSGGLAWRSGRLRLSELSDAGATASAKSVEAAQLQAWAQRTTVEADQAYPGTQQQQQQRQQAAVEGGPPSASLTRMAYSVQPSRFPRPASTGGSRGGPALPVPSSLLFLAITLGTAVVAGMRARMRHVRGCATCRGYGVQRCKLCNGRGTIEWEGKMAHREPCPLCLGRRFNSCSCCGGGRLFGRSLLPHKNVRREVALMAQLQALTDAGKQRSRPWRLRGGSGGDSDERNQRMEQSDELAEQIMMD